MERALVFAAALLAVNFSLPRPEALAAARRTTAPLTSDAELEGRIRARLQRSKTGTDSISVRVTAGVAYLDGATSVPQRKGTATRLAKLAGAKSVVNRIRVLPNPGAAEAGPRRALVRRP